MKDVQDQPAHTYCSESGDELYKGEYCLVTEDGNVLKDDFETLMKHYFVKRKVVGEETIG